VTRTIANEPAGRRRSAGAPRVYRWSDGSPAYGWSPAGRVRRLAAWCVDLLVFAASLGVGWTIWAWRTWPSGTTPGKRALGLAVFDTGSARPASRRQMVLRTLVYQALALLVGVFTLGVGWLYCLGGVFGAQRRTVYDEWSNSIVLSAPRRSGGGGRESNPPDRDARSRRF
jgi:RDD family protein